MEKCLGNAGPVPAKPHYKSGHLRVEVAFALHHMVTDKVIV